MRSLLRFSTWSLVLLSVAQCNVYKPFRGASSDEDYIEEAVSCLIDDDYSCAIENYQKLGDAELKSQKLCTTYLSQAGLGIAAVTGTISDEDVGSMVLSSLATQLLPWSQEKSTASDNAKTECAKITDAALSALLKTLSLFIHCSTRIAKTDTRLGSSASDETCSTPGNADGKITQGDISDRSDGTIGSKGMCELDVTECRNDILALNAGALSGAGLTDIKEKVDILVAFGFGSLINSQARKAIRDTSPAD